MSEEREEKKQPSNRKKQFIEILKFTGFSISAGVIQFVSTGVLSTWTGWIPHSYYWVAYLIGLVLSVVWNFTLNRKFTFRSASNVPIAMTLVVIYYCAFTPLSTFGADAMKEAWETAAGSGWNDNYELVITASMMILNFVTEFVWDKFVVFNDKVVNKIELLFKKKKSEAPATGDAAEPALTEEEQTVDETATQSAKEEIAATEETANEENAAAENDAPMPEEEITVTEDNTTMPEEKSDSDETD